MAGPSIRVDRARLVRPRPGDRERLRSALDLATPASTGVTERALLLIPKLRVERPLASGIEDFANELIDRIRAAKVAARRGPPGGEGAHYFEDDIALEIEIVRAWLGGTRLPEAVSRTIPLSDTPVTRWRRHVLADLKKLPRLVAALVEADLADQWIARFTDGELIAAAGRLVRAYGGTLPEPANEANESSGPAAPEAVTGRDGPVPIPAALVEIRRTARGLAPRKAARVFLAAALVAARRPSLVATRAFKAAIASIFRADGLADAPRLKSTPEPGARPGAPRGTHDTHRRADPASPELPATHWKSPASPARPATGAPRSPWDGSAPRSANPVAEDKDGAVTTVDSDHAGLFFLLNVFGALGLYGDFADLERRLRGLSPFELLLWLGRHFRGREFQADPIEPLLRSLAGLGPRERPGRHFEAARWQIPDDWLAPWPRQRPRLIRTTYGSSLWHPAGFPIEDRWDDPRPAAWRRRRWVTCFANYVEARLWRALDAASREQAVATLIDRPGTVRVDAEQVEIDFALDTHPLSIRLAGLDRDPGWIPAAGCDFRFRFS